MKKDKYEKRFFLIAFNSACPKGGLNDVVESSEDSLYLKEVAQSLGSEAEYYNRIEIFDTCLKRIEILKGGE